MADSGSYSCSDMGSWSGSDSGFWSGSSVGSDSGVGARNSAVVVGLPRWGPTLSPRVPNLVPIPGPRMERETPSQRCVGAGNSAVVVDLPRCGPMLSPRVPNLVPIPGPRMERETPGQRPRPNYEPAITTRAQRPRDGGSAHIVNCGSVAFFTNRSSRGGPRSLSGLAPP